MSRVSNESRPDLQGAVAELLGRHHEKWIAVRVTHAGPEVARQGIAADADVEIGSVSKGLTGLLYADAITRGEVTPGTTLAEVLPLEGCDAGAITLDSLSTHTSGLPRLAVDSGALAGTWNLWRHGTNPYGASLDTLVERTRATGVGRAKAAYSNLGFMLLGHALAAATGTTYAALLAERLATPMGLTDTSVPASASELSPRAVQGTNRRGTPVDAWTGVDVGPAGGVRMSARDLVTLLRALLDDSAPGMGALDPVRSFGGPASRIGAGWMTLETKQGEVTWHNGGTGGFRSIVTLDRVRHRGVAIVTATTRSVDRAGFTLVRPAA